MLASCCRRGLQARATEQLEEHICLNSRNTSRLKRFPSSTTRKPYSSSPLHPSHIQIRIVPRALEREDDTTKRRREREGGESTRVGLEEGRGEGGE